VQDLKNAPPQQQQQQQQPPQQQQVPLQPPPQIAYQPQAIPPFQQQPFAPYQPPGYGPYIPIAPWQMLPIPVVEEKRPSKISQVEIDLTSEGVKSNDVRLHTKEELAAFFETYGSRPQAVITVWGYHHERRTSGTGKNRSTRTVTVTDFRYNFELSPYILPGTMGANRDAVFDAYLASGNALKRCMMDKTLGWNEVPLLQRIEARVREMGWSRCLSVTQGVVKPQVKVENGDSCSKFLRHPCTDFMCIVTCMCMFYYPIKWCYEIDFKFGMVYPVGVTTDQFFQAIYPQIRCWN